MSGVKGRSGPRIQSKVTLDRLCTHARQVSLRAIRDESIPLIERGRLATQFPLKEMADKKESVVINLNLSDELMRRIMARLNIIEAAALPEPDDIYITPTIEPNEPNESDDTNASSRNTAPPSTPDPT
jgi:hypothetical protein